MLNFIGEKMPSNPDIYEKFVEHLLKQGYKEKIVDYIKGKE